VVVKYGRARVDLIVRLQSSPEGRSGKNLYQEGEAAVSMGRSSVASTLHTPDEKRPHEAPVPPPPPNRERR